ncbi:MAG: helix-turn-helix transcriptional regulator [Acidimicrobiales bacterium]
MAAGALEGVAGLELDHGRPAVAVRLFGAAAAVRAEGAVTYRLGWQSDYDADLGVARASLDGGAFAEEWQRGMELRLPDAVELARRGRGERGRPTFGWDSLTATEQRVAALLVEGCTNPEIAQTLLMGRETVKTHVSSILRKLGLANRTQVASALAAREAK